ncbi:nucleoside phosphorylase domain-containing protein [Aspergillus leporis]|uniref:Nucleoside phosphorylase domain-containing protein n=1 Tax=Aspergillus leporis TaxID=41062 RepID=A0A5N5WVI8_9EURO|nr:nucleoside phosphorylase domain-containing protein [Aspergillus leporis]
MPRTSNLGHQHYTVGWICALPKEMAAAQATLDEKHPPLLHERSDPNTYTLDRIGSHNVGLFSAAIVANHMRSTFKSLRVSLVVGVGGGVPSNRDIQLSDVVVGEPTGSFRRRTGSLNRPPAMLLTGVSRLKSWLSSARFEAFGHISCPGVQHDHLYQADYDRQEEGASCENCDLEKLANRLPRDSNDPGIHYGLVASGNRELDVICFEMEAAGLMDDFSCLVIWGICDYSDSHKHKLRQGPRVTRLQRRRHILRNS